MDPQNVKIKALLLQLAPPVRKREEQSLWVFLSPGSCYSTGDSKPRPRVPKESSNSVLSSMRALREGDSVDRNVNGPRVSVANPVHSGSLASEVDPEEGSDHGFFLTGRNGVPSGYP